MASIRRIVFPVDFSERCVGAARHVEILAGRNQAEVTLLHIDPPQDPVWVAHKSFDVNAWEEYLADRRLKLEEKLQEYLKDETKYFQVKRKLCSGDPARSIVAFADTKGTDLIMMPTHGMGPFRRFILGSVTAKVLHDAHCPVWTAVHAEHAPALEEIHVRRILCAIEPGPDAGRVLSWAAGLAEDFDSELTLVHAVPAVPTRPAKYLDSAFFGKFVAIGELQGQAGTGARLRIAEGRPAEAVSEAAAVEKSDLVVIGRTGTARGIGRLRADGYSIIRSAPCPVISV